MPKASQAHIAKHGANTELVVLGIAQDAGYPQTLCYQPHCMPAWQDKSLRKMATSLAVVDHAAKAHYLFEATPDLPQQLYLLQQEWSQPDYLLQGVFLTHAHMGHYTGLMHFGRESAATKQIAVYAMPAMRSFLENNGPWSQLVKLKNIELKTLQHQREVTLGSIKVTPLLVPHRDEFSETVGYLIKGPTKTALFIPDIDKWQKWSTAIEDLIPQVDYALLDATFYSADELKGRTMADVPHPLVIESMSRLKNLAEDQKQKIIFIHLNHTNPLLKPSSPESLAVTAAGFRIANEGLILPL
ncbi:MBL fold metallo-hydrolase [Shewanella sp. NIFS-20-20]|uniref:MBL fold metallo-hydrolase n=1 Tax=Shewanella sp. NIFS-20-20 TaxID=2853806 RepID=UPI0035270969